MITKHQNFASKETKNEYANLAEQRSRYYMSAAERSIADYQATGQEVYATNARVLAYQSDNWLRRANCVRAMTDEQFAMWLAYQHMIGAYPSVNVQ